MFFKDDNDVDDDEISSTPALAPSRLAQNITDYQPPIPVDEVGSEVHSAASSDYKEHDDNPIEENCGLQRTDEEEEGAFNQTTESSFTVDPALSKSFLSFLYDVEVVEKPEAEDKVLYLIYL